MVRSFNPATVRFESDAESDDEQGHVSIPQRCDLNVAGQAERNKGYVFQSRNGAI